MKPGELEQVLDMDYHIGCKIGSGGFGKVYLATHVITLQKVAIKVMIKRKLGDDLPRVAREIKALKQLNHQNIAQLFQVVETSEAFVLVLEYCRGGEVFDYIVNKSRLPEEEARQIFRQILAALCFIHERGFCHRDLKPENVLLAEDKEVKIIDFGLCAMPGTDGTGRDFRLETMCGSMAYAAPELLKGEKYIGREVDIWSLGVVLFTLVAGYLPFDGDDNGMLSRAIQSGLYVQPDFLSFEVKNLIQGMLQVNPKSRLKIKHLVQHPWVNMGYKESVDSTSIYEMEKIDMDIVDELAMFYKMSPNALVDKLSQWKYDHLTATYLILTHRKLRRLPIRLTRSAIPGANDMMEMSGWAGSTQSVETMTAASNTKLEQWLVPPPPQNTSRRALGVLQDNPEPPTNMANLTFSMDSGLQNISIEAIATPRKARHRPPPQLPPLSSPSYENIPPPLPPPRTPDPAEEFQLSMASNNSSGLQNSHGKRWVHSFEKGLEKMKNIMTPRSKKTKAAVRQEPAMAKTLHNVACGYQKDPDALFLSLKTAMEKLGIQCKVKGPYCLQGKQIQPGHDSVTFVLEICQIPLMNGIVGIKRKRITGESWHYKKVVEQIMRNVQEFPSSPR